MDRRTFLFSALATSVIGSSAAEARSAWVQLGSTTLRWRTNRETIPAFPRGPINNLQFRTRTEPVFITTVDVFFDRERERLVPDQRIWSGAPSRVLALRHRGREIRRVEFDVRRQGHARLSPASVELYGRR